mmetsp:Transcript_8333/g.19007  ORF Transcript_8333/g.19007 Transcript_8333/m.19007 type:complete len:280 (-) Transcript_8333:650-1489(-)
MLLCALRRRGALCRGGHRWWGHLRDGSDGRWKTQRGRRGAPLKGHCLLRLDLLPDPQREEEEQRQPGTVAHRLQPVPPGRAILTVGHLPGGVFQQAPAELAHTRSVGTGALLHHSQRRTHYLEAVHGGVQLLEAAGRLAGCSQCWEGSQGCKCGSCGAWRRRQASRREGIGGRCGAFQDAGHAQEHRADAEQVHHFGLGNRIFHADHCGGLRHVPLPRGGLPPGKPSRSSAGLQPSLLLLAWPRHHGDLDAEPNHSAVHQELLVCIPALLLPSSGSLLH